MIDNAEIIDSNATAKDEVSLGKTVTFKELPNEEPETYAIVGSVEADPLAGKFLTSLQWQCLIGKRSEKPLLFHYQMVLALTLKLLT